MVWRRCWLSLRRFLGLSTLSVEQPKRASSKCDAPRNREEGGRVLRASGAHDFLAEDALAVKSDLAAVEALQRHVGSLKSGEGASSIELWVHESRGVRLEFVIVVPNRAPSEPVVRADRDVPGARMCPGGFGAHESLKGGVLVPIFHEL